VRAFPPLLLLLLIFFSGCERAPARTSLPLPQQVYVWQRGHAAAVSDAVRAHAQSFHSLLVLAAEVTWKKSAPTPTPQIARVPLDWPALQTAPRLGLAIRINAYPGPFLSNDATINALVALARALLAEASAHSITITELQIDFDAATSKLPGYRLWLETLRTAIAPIPLTFTALPAWLRSDNFPALARTAPNYVLQVHSLARPEQADEPFTLCDPDAALSAIDRAARLNVPFRVALPTYGYTLAYDSSGHFAGLSAEGPRPSWKPDFTLREIHADSAELAALVHTLSTEHPVALTSLIWYRLPIASDQLNWSWPTLAAVMQGRSPSPHLRIMPQPQGDGLFQLTLVNDGEGDFSGPVRAFALWHEARRIGADALNNFSLTAEDTTSLQFTATTCLLPAGAQRVIGWLRLSDPKIFPDVLIQN